MKRIRSALAVFSLVATAACSSGPQPHMHRALEHLKEARAELEAAEADKGGHRVKAIELTDAAIAQTKEGIEVGRERR